MKSLTLFTVLCSLAFSTNAQKGLFTFSDSLQYTKEISRILDDKVIFEDDTYAAYADILKVEFDETVHVSTLNVFRNRNILVVVSKSIPENITPEAIKTVSSQPSDTERIDQLEKSLEAFRQSRSSAKTFGALGAIGLGTYFILSNKYVNEVKKGKLDAKAPSVVIPIVSSFVIGISFAVDGAAGDNLKRKR